MGIREDQIERMVLARATLENLANAVTFGPHAKTIEDLLQGKRIIVVKQNLDASGWIVTTEPVDSARDS